MRYQILIILAVMVLLASIAYAINYNDIANGQYNVTTIWSPNGLPCSSGDYALIDSHQVTMYRYGTYYQPCQASIINITTGGTLYFDSYNTLTVYNFSEGTMYLDGGSLKGYSANANTNPKLYVAGGINVTKDSFFTVGGYNSPYDIYADIKGSGMITLNQPYSTAGAVTELYGNNSNYFGMFNISHGQLYFVGTVGGEFCKDCSFLVSNSDARLAITKLDTSGREGPQSIIVTNGGTFQPATYGAIGILNWTNDINISLTDSTLYLYAQGSSFDSLITEDIWFYGSNAITVQYYYYPGIYGSFKGDGNISVTGTNAGYYFYLNGNNENYTGYFTYDSLGSMTFSTQEALFSGSPRTILSSSTMYLNAVPNIDWTFNSYTVGDTLWRVELGDGANRLTINSTSLEVGNGSINNTGTLNIDGDLAFSNDATLLMNVINHTKFDLLDIDFELFDISNATLNITIGSDYNFTPINIVTTTTNLAGQSFKEVNWLDTEAVMEITYGNGFISINGTEGGGDSTPPTISLPPNATIEFHYESLTEQINVTDDSNVSYVWINDTANFKINQSGYLENNTNLSVGTYIINITANDTLNNQGSAFYRVDVSDTIPPVITFFNDSFIIKYGAAMEIHTIESSDISGLNTTNYQTNDTKFTVANSGDIFNTSITPVGFYMVNVSVTDPYGNLNSSITNITVYACDVDADCGLCEKCSANACINQDLGEDIKTECDDEVNCSIGYCNGAGACAMEVSGDAWCPACHSCSALGDCEINNAYDGINDSIIGNNSGLCENCWVCSMYGTGECVEEDADSDLSKYCGGVECDDGGFPDSYYHGWDTLECYYRLDETADEHLCEGDGTCYDADDAGVCEYNNQDGTAGVVCSCLAAEIGCLGTTAGTCNETLCSSPLWYDNMTSIPLVYSPTIYSYFNITWNGSLDVDTVFFESNISGVPFNYSMNNITLQNYNYSALFGVGAFYWKSYANNSQNNWNESDTWLFTIGKASPVLNLTLNGTEGNRVFRNGTTINLSCSLLSGDTGGMLYLYNNFTLINNGTSVISNLTLLDCGECILNITCNYTDGDNYTDGQISYLLEVGIGDVTYPSITLSYPFNNTKHTEFTRNFVFTATDNKKISNISLFIDNALNTTNTSGVNGSYNIALTFPYVNHTYSWLVEACDNSSNCINSSARNLIMLYDNPSDDSGIDNCVELQSMLYKSLSGDYNLSGNVDCSDSINWNNNGTVNLGYYPSGTFTGTLNGQGYTIGDLYIYRPTAIGVGLFSGLRTDAYNEVYNFTMSNVNITGYQSIGSIAGTTNTAIYLNDINVTGNIQGVYRYLGGLMGTGRGHLKNIHTDMNITLDSALSGTGTGGFVGFLAASLWIDNSSSSGTFSGYDRTGGLLGDSSGFNCNVIINQSFSDAVVYSSNEEVGGLLARSRFSNITIDNSYYIGNNIGAGSKTVGGLVGTIFNDVGYHANIFNSYSVTNITAPSGILGGLIGNDNGLLTTIRNSFTASNLSTTINSGSVGRYAPDISENIYWLNSSGNLDVAYFDGSSVNTTAITDITYFQGDVYPVEDPMAEWQFFDVWEERIDNYPSLTWQHLGDDMTIPTIDSMSFTRGADYILAECTASDNVGISSYNISINATGLSISGLGVCSYLFEGLDTGGYYNITFYAFDADVNVGLDSAITSTFSAINKSWTPQGNLNLRGRYEINNIYATTWVSSNGSIWTCRVNNTGIFICS